MVWCRVALLDGSTFELKGIDKNSNGHLVFDEVTKYINLIETDYFGLTFRDETNRNFWLNNTKKISKQVKGGAWLFEFHVKFYPPDPITLKENITRYQLSLQVRKDLYNGRLLCSFATYALLGSYTVQAELGDWDQKKFGDSVEYIHDFNFAPGQNIDLLKKIVELHKTHRGQTPAVADANFLKNAKTVNMYGEDMHDVKDAEDKKLSLGICANGVSVYQDRVRISRFVWSKILKIEFVRDLLKIKIINREQHEITIGFRCHTYKLAKSLWKSCVEHHAFFRLETAFPKSSSTFSSRFLYSGRTAVEARKAAEMIKREEPHIVRTAERRSFGNKHKDAILEGDRNTEEIYSKVQKRPTCENASDKLDHQGAEVITTYKACVG
ncbi:band 4.1-like protein 3 isoform X2 [Mercenaria mercenaria]|uniref:band 4.1-like protein 3 isoform X2 n=1 Tax=Mercenaria mercenaria TaxID=6596 RepID=UPI00234F7C7B|nr:band 4.1-like protein 3 isoform X2 [Mercenaria mercenaria]